VGKGRKRTQNELKTRIKQNENELKTAFSMENEYREFLLRMEVLSNLKKESDGMKKIMKREIKEIKTEAGLPKRGRGRPKEIVEANDSDDTELSPDLKARKDFLKGKIQNRKERLNSIPHHPTT